MTMATTNIADAGVDPLASFLTGRDGWTKDDDGAWCHPGREIRVVTMGPGRVDRFQISIKGSRSVNFATVTGVECFVTAASA